MRFSNDFPNILQKKCCNLSPAHKQVGEYSSDVIRQRFVSHQEVYEFRLCCSEVELQGQTSHFPKVQLLRDCTASQSKTLLVFFILTSFGITVSHWIFIWYVHFFKAFNNARKSVNELSTDGFRNSCLVLMSNCTMHIYLRWLIVFHCALPSNVISVKRKTGQIDLEVIGKTVFVPW